MGRREQLRVDTSSDEQPYGVIRLELLLNPEFCLALGSFLLFATIGLNELIKAYPEKAKKIAERIRGRPFDDEESDVNP